MIRYASHLLAWVLLASLAHAAEPVTLLQNGVTVGLNAQGAPARVERDGKPLIVDPGAPDPAGMVVLGTSEYRLETPTDVRRLDDTHARYAFTVPSRPAVTVELLVTLDVTPAGVSVRRDVTVRAPEKLAHDLTVSLPSRPGLTSTTWLPRFDGTGGPLGDQPAAVYRFAGAVPGDGVRLAIPMVSTPLPGSAGRATVVADPLFSTRFTRGAVAWRYPAAVGLEGNAERRSITLVVHEGTPEVALAAFYREALPDVPPGPAWLHDIAMVDYDYMSDEGRGWFRDIDALAAAIPPADRRQVFLCLHGWYDWVGRYGFDPTTRKLDAAWTAFGRYDEVKQNASTMDLEGTKVDTGFAKCRPVAMSLKSLHERLAAARKAGFRVGLYFADGLIAGTNLPGYDTPRRILSMGGWPGPDTPGKAFCQNPLVPEVAAFYTAYAEALLAEFGSEIDALVWDETNTVPAGSLGSKEVAGYADRAMMRLVRGVASRVEQFNRGHGREVALLTSDCLGAWGQAPYALMAHGTYQDTWNRPDGWSFAIFPNYRNVVWSCCWWPESKPGWVEFGVRTYQAPVAISNGWGDNLGFAELSTARRDQVLALFHARKQAPTRLRWFDVLPVYKPAVSRQP